MKSISTKKKYGFFNVLWILIQLLAIGLSYLISSGKIKKRRFFIMACLMMFALGILSVVFFFAVGKKS